MDSVIADTSAWVAFFHGDPSETLELALEACRLELPSLVKLELLGAPFTSQERKKLEDALALLPVIVFDEAQILKAAELKASLETKGYFMSARDAVLLQCVLDRNALLLTKDPLFLSLEKTCNLRISM